MNHHSLHCSHFLVPMQNTIKNLVKEIEAARADIQENEREWLKRQTEMVSAVLWLRDGV